MTDFEALIRRLGAADLRFVLVGGFAATILGSPRTTVDLDRARPLGVSTDGVVGRRRHSAVGDMLRLVAKGLDSARQSRRKLGHRRGSATYALRSTG